MAEQAGVNMVDVSPETVAAEWASIEADEGLANIQEPAQGKTPGVSDSPAPIPASTDQLAGRAAGFLKTAFRYGFKYLTPAWAITRDECSKLGDAWGKVAAKYLPPAWLAWIPAADGGNSVCIECDAIALTIEILEPRINTPAAPVPVESEKNETATDATPAALQDGDV